MLDQTLTFTGHIVKKIKQARSRLNCLIGRKIILWLNIKLISQLKDIPARQTGRRYRSNRTSDYGWSANA